MYNQKIVSVPYDRLNPLDDSDYARKIAGSRLL
jgi:hypothetical protein